MSVHNLQFIVHPIALPLTGLTLRVFRVILPFLTCRVLVAAFSPEEEEIVALFVSYGCQATKTVPISWVSGAEM
jgi:hypothetical protein